MSIKTKPTSVKKELFRFLVILKVPYVNMRNEMCVDSCFWGQTIIICSSFEEFELEIFWRNFCSAFPCNDYFHFGKKITKNHLFAYKLCAHLAKFSCIWFLSSSLWIFDYAENISIIPKVFFCVFDLAECLIVYACLNMYSVYKHLNANMSKRVI